MLYTFNQMQRQEDLYIQYQPCLYNEFKACQSYIVKLSLKKSPSKTKTYHHKYKVAPVQAAAFISPFEKQLLCTF
jgi:hypothetical protein